MIKLVQGLCKRSLFPLIWTFVTLILLCLPGNAIPGIGLFGIKHLDKVAHIILFGGFVLFWGVFYWFRKTNEKSWFGSLFLISLISIAIGIIMEYVQRNFIPNRSFDVGDIWADVAGSLFVALLLLTSGRRIGLLL